MHTRSTRHTAAVGAVILAAAGLPFVATTATAAPECRLVALERPVDGIESGVMDIEVVDGRTVYYGNYQRILGDGSLSQRALVWRGIDGQPEEVGPLDAPVNIAFELTASGLINGQAEYPDGTFRPWIQDLTSGDLTWLQMADSAAVDANGGRLRRINDAGATVGIVGTGKGGSRWNAKAVGHDSPTAPLETLASNGRYAEGWGINNLGQRVGFVQHRNLRAAPHWALWLPTIWEADGSSRTAAMPGTDGMLFSIEDDGQMAGMTFLGSPASGHFEPTHWADADHYETLGVLEGGGWGRPFGADADAQVGYLDLVPEPGDAPEWALDDIFVYYGYYWERGMADRVRILPTLHNVASGATDWRDFHGVGAVHAVHTGLDQAATGTHSGFDSDGMPTFDATVYLNSSACGVEVETTHDPFHLTDISTAMTYTQSRG